jgi:hypothetical protein
MNMANTAHLDEQTYPDASESTDEVGVEDPKKNDLGVATRPTHKRPSKRGRNGNSEDSKAKRMKRDAQYATIYNHTAFRRNTCDEIVRALVVEDANANAFQVRECIEQNESTFEIYLHYRQGHVHVEKFVIKGNAWKLKVRGVEWSCLLIVKYCDLTKQCSHSNLQNDDGEYESFMELLEAFLDSMSLNLLKFSTHEKFVELSEEEVDLKIFKEFRKDSSNGHVFLCFRTEISLKALGSLRYILSGGHFGSADIKVCPNGFEWESTTYQSLELLFRAFNEIPHRNGSPSSCQMCYASPGRPDAPRHEPEYYA